MGRANYNLTLMLLLGMLSPSAAALEVYRWADADGVVNYGPRKPSDMPSQRVTIRHDTETSAQAEEKLNRVVKEADRGAKEEEPTLSADAGKEADAELRRACVTTAHNLEKLQNWAKHILVKDDSGTPVTMDSLQRQAAIERMRNWMAENKCP